MARVLAAPEISLLALMEVIFGVTLAWMVTPESPSAGVLIGGALVVGSLAINEWLELRTARHRSLE